MNDKQNLGKLGEEIVAKYLKRTYQMDYIEEIYAK